MGEDRNRAMLDAALARAGQAPRFGTRGHPDPIFAAPSRSLQAPPLNEFLQRDHPASRFGALPLPDVAANADELVRQARSNPNAPLGLGDVFTETAPDFIPGDGILPRGGPEASEPVSPFTFEPPDAPYDPAPFSLDDDWQTTGAARALYGFRDQDDTRARAVPYYIADPQTRPNTPSLPMSGASRSVSQSFAPATQDELDRREAHALYADRERERAAPIPLPGVAQIARPIVDAITDPEARELGPDQWLGNARAMLGLGAEGEGGGASIQWDEIMPRTRANIAGGMDPGIAALPAAASVVGDWWNDAENDFSRSARMGRGLVDAGVDADYLLGGYIPDAVRGVVYPFLPQADEARQGLNWERSYMEARANNGDGPQAFDASARTAYAGQVGATGIDAALNFVAPEAMGAGGIRNIGIRGIEAVDDGVSYARAVPRGEPITLEGGVPYPPRQGEVIDPAYPPMREVPPSGAPDGGAARANPIGDWAEGLRENQRFVRSGADPNGGLTYEIVSPDVWRFRSSWLPEGERGQGAGVAAYESVLQSARENGVPYVESSAVLSGDSTNVYRALERRGYAVTRASDETGAPVFRVSTQSPSQPSPATGPSGPLPDVMDADFTPLPIPEGALSDTTLQAQRVDPLDPINTRADGRPLFGMRPDGTIATIGGGAAIGAGAGFAADELFGDEAYADEGEGEGSESDLILPILGAGGAAALAAFKRGRMAPAARSQVGMFAGINARTANREALAQAERMAAAGASREDIWRDTGWFQGVDGKWRWEIDDSGAQIAPDMLERHSAASVGSSQRRPLSEGLQHDELNAAYDLSDTSLDLGRLSRGAAGEFDPNRPSVSMYAANDPDMLRSGVMHETQHRLQRSEGFATGGQPERMFEDELTAINSQLSRTSKEMDHWRSYRRNGPQFYAEADENLARLRADYDGLLERRAREINPTTQRDAYNRLAGEVEARNVQTRRDFTPEQRRATPPWETQDVPDADQIISFGRGDRQAMRQFLRDANSKGNAQRRFLAAVRDPETGQVFSGLDHVEAIESAPAGVRERLQSAYDADDAQTNPAFGFSVDNQFMGREEGLAAIRPARRSGFDENVTPEPSEPNGGNAGTNRPRGRATGDARAEQIRRNERILELITQMRPDPNRSGIGRWAPPGNGYADIARRLNEEGFADVTPNVVKGVLNRARSAEAAAAAPPAGPAPAAGGDEAAAARLGMSVERYRQLSARQRDALSIAIPLGAGGALAFGIANEADAAEGKPMPFDFDLNYTPDPTEVPLTDEERQRIKREREAFYAGNLEEATPAGAIDFGGDDDGGIQPWMLGLPIIAGVAGGRYGRRMGERTGQPLMHQAIGGAVGGALGGAGLASYSDEEDAGEAIGLGAGIGLGATTIGSVAREGARQAGPALRAIPFPNLNATVRSADLQPPQNRTRFGERSTQPMLDEAVLERELRAGMGERVIPIPDAAFTERVGGRERSVFGEAPQPRQRQPLPPLDVRAAEQGAQGALRGATPTKLRAIADDLGIESAGRSTADLRSTLVRELGRRFDSTKELVSFLGRYGIPTALVGLAANGEAEADD